jgi:peptide chain release factor 3
VLEYRLTHEYGVDIRIEQLPYNLARWAIGENLTQGLLKALDNLVLKDDEDNFVVLFRNEWSLNWEVNNKKQVTYLDHPPSI